LENPAVTKFSVFSLLAFVGLAAVTASPAMAKEQASKTWTASKAAHLRVAPSSESPIVASVPKDAVLTSYQPCARGWCAVEYRGIRGWIYDALLVEQLGKAMPATTPEPLEKASLQRPSPPPTATASYRVIGLGAEESLPIRESPTDTARVVGELSPAAKNIAGLETCMRQWCLIEHDGARGYVRNRFLARLDEGSSPRYAIHGEANLKVFSFGGSDADVVGEIPYYAVGIVPIGDCNGEWCHVRYLGLVGFVDARRLRPETSLQR
jgi:SH3-like domain-containing protein